MTELMKKAIAKIDAEGEKGGTNQKRIAQYIIDALITDDISAGKVADGKKSLADCVKAVTGKARKHAENGCAMVEDETVYSWIREYYGITEEPKTIIMALMTRPLKTPICGMRRCRRIWKTSATILAAGLIHMSNIRC